MCQYFRTSNASSVASFTWVSKLWTINSVKEIRPSCVNIHGKGGIRVGYGERAGERKLMSDRERDLRMGVGSFCRGALTPTRSRQVPWHSWRGL